VAVLRERRSGLLEKLEHARSESSASKKRRGGAGRGAPPGEEQVRLERVQQEKGSEEESLAVRLAALGPVLEEPGPDWRSGSSYRWNLFQARVNRNRAPAPSGRGRRAEGPQRGAHGTGGLAGARGGEVRTILADTARAIEESAKIVDAAKRGVQEAVERIAGVERRIAEQDEIEKRAREAHAALEGATRL